MDRLFSLLSGGLTQASWWVVTLFTLVTTHITIVSVTIFLHRSQAHRSLDLHPVAMHFFRFWLWMTTGMVTKEWVAIHRKHHAKCEREGDPHSPVLFGIWKVLFYGAELYRYEARNAKTITNFGHGTPDDWLERHIYSQRSLLGIFITLSLDVALFGAAGVTVWAVQMAWIPFWAAGVVNGLGHYRWGYRNYASPDTSINLSPLGILIGGEELHNNHHAYATSAKFSIKWYEFDIGWLYVRTLSFFRLAKVKKVVPKLKLTPHNNSVIDLNTLRSIITHRYEVMARYTKLIKCTMQKELSRLRPLERAGILRPKQLQEMLHETYRKINFNEEVMKLENHAEIGKVVAQIPSLAILVQMQRELVHLWCSSNASSEQLLSELQSWCKKAKESRISGLEQFANRLCRYAA